MYTLSSIHPVYKNPPSPQLKTNSLLAYPKTRETYIMCGYRRNGRYREYSKLKIQLSQMPVLEVLVLLVWIWVGVGILGEVEGQHFADDTISLLWINSNE